MKFKYRVLLLLFVLILIPFNNIKAESCDSVDIKRLKVLASNIDISYEYNSDLKDSAGYPILNTYKVTFNNMTDELYVFDASIGIDYKNNSIKDGVLIIDDASGGKKTYKIYSKACDKSLKTYYVKLPVRNMYYEDEVCKGYEELDVCQEFTENSITYADILKAITEYDEKNTDDDGDVVEPKPDILSKFLKGPFMIIIGVIIVVAIVMIVITIRKKRRVLD